MSKEKTISQVVKLIKRHHQECILINAFPRVASHDIQMNVTPGALLDWIGFKKSIACLSSSFLTKLD